jgi:NAD-dependent SIR2 family protein deacetylase
MPEIRGSLGTVECAKCGSTRFNIPSSEKDDPLIKCRCGATVGPIKSLRAFVHNEAHTHVNAKIKKPTWI